jgi:hypothetical protein
MNLHVQCLLRLLAQYEPRTRKSGETFELKDNLMHKNNNNNKSKTTQKLRQNKL